jgi:hypothetical protein
MEIVLIIYMAGVLLYLIAVFFMRGYTGTNYRARDFLEALYWFLTLFAYLGYYFKMRKLKKEKKDGNKS